MHLTKAASWQALRASVTSGDMYVQEPSPGLLKRKVPLS